MEKINLPMASEITSPNPVTVVCTQKPDGDTNLATVSWWTYLSYNPSMVAFAMAKTSFSGEMIRQNKKVVITIPSEKIINAVLGCGSTTGRNTNKIKKFGIEMSTLPETDIKVPAHSCLAIESTLKEFIETGDYYLYICSVDQVYADKQEKAVFAWNGYSKIISV